MLRGTLGLRSLETRARHEARRRGQTPSTAHLLVVMLQAGDDAAQLLRRFSLHEGDLLAALRDVESESASAIERTFERATKTAREVGAREATGLHVLYAIATDERSCAHRVIARQIAIDGIRAATRAALGLTETAPRAPETGGKPRTVGVAAAAPETPSRVAPRFPPSSGMRRQLAMATKRTVSPAPAIAKEASVVEATPVTEAPRAEAAPRGPRRNVRVDARPSDAPRVIGPFELDPARFPLLASIGRNLTAMADEGRIDPVVGRDREIEAVLDVLARRRSNNPLLVGPPGVGKTAIVEGLALAIVRGGEGALGLEGRIVVEISAGSLVSGTGVRGAVAERIRKLRAEVAASDGRVVVFLDEIHAIVGGDGPDDVANELKAALARGELPCIGATTDAELRKYFEKDAALARRFSPIPVDEPSNEATLAILLGVATAYESHHHVTIEREALESAIELSVRFLPERKLPDKAVSVVDLAAARVRRRGGTIVDRKAIASVIAEQAQVPIERLLLRDADRLLELEHLLGDRVVGHADSRMRIAEALRKGAAGFRGKRPLGTFLFLGPTGVGKTEMAKAVNDVFFAASPMTRFDMSEFSEAHSVARLFGAPPGYVGHDEAGQLTEAVRRRPYQLVLLDEIEKAHPDVLLALLPLLDEGRLTDGKGRTVDFTNTIVVLTSNLGAHAPEERRGRIGFGNEVARSSDDRGTRVLEAARRALPPELWNRIDEPLYFGALAENEVGEIARRMLRSLERTLFAEHGVSLEIDESAIATLVALGGYDVGLGARPMKRTIGRLVESKLAREILEGLYRRGDVVRLIGSESEVRLECVSGVAAE